MPDDPRLVRNDTIRTFLTPFAIVASAVGVGVTVWHSDQAQRRQAGLDFQLEAARIVMAEPTCDKQVAKAEQLRYLFPGRLPANFGRPFVLFPSLVIKNGKLVRPNLCPSS